MPRRSAPCRLWPACYSANCSRPSRCPRRLCPGCCRPRGGRHGPVARRPPSCPLPCSAGRSLTCPCPCAACCCLLLLNELLLPILLLLVRLHLLLHDLGVAPDHATRIHSVETIRLTNKAGVLRVQADVRCRKSGPIKTRLGTQHFRPSTFLSPPPSAAASLPWWAALACPCRS